MIALILSAVLLALHVAGLVFAIHAARHTHTAQGAVAWALALFLLPYIAVPVYLFLGPMRPGELTPAQKAFRKAAYEDLLARELPANAKAELPQRWAVLETFAPAPPLRAHPPQILTDTAVFDAIFAMIGAAQRCIVVQFFIFRDDDLGRRLQAELCRLARSGIEIQLLYDGIGARKAPERFWNELRSAGVDVRPFHIERRLPKILRLNYRNHRKLVAVDRREAVIGGPNVGIEYLGLDPHFGPWRDTAVLIKGTAAAVAQAAFEVDWQWAGGTPSETIHSDKLEATSSKTPILLLPTGPADALPVCSLAFMHLVAEAKERLWIASPYFVPDLDMISTLQLAALRGVDVRVIIPDNPDHALVWLAAFSYADEVKRAGVKIYRYTDGFMHQKIILVDDDLAGVGTVNLDNRSFHLNFENTVFVVDRGFASDIATMLEADFARSELYGDISNKVHRRIVRVLAPATRLLAPLL